MNFWEDLNPWLYGGVNVFNDKNITLPNILTSSQSLEAALEIWEWEDRFHPLKCDFNGDTLTITNSRYLYHDDPHFNEISRYFEKLKSPFSFNRSTQSIRSPLWYSHILNLPNTPEDVRKRQSGIRALIENTELFEAVEGMFSELQCYSSSQWHYWEQDYEALMNPIKAKELLQKLQNIANISDNLGAFWDIWEWCQEISEDSYFQHILKERYKVSDHHILSFYSQRFGNRVWATLRPWVKIEDFCDIIPQSGESYTAIVGKWRNKKVVERRVIYAETFGDQHKDEIPFARVRQRIDNIKEMAAASLSIPLFLLLTQLKQLYLGALMHKDYEKRGFPVCFPEISDDPYEFSFEELYPIWWVQMFEDRDTLMPNSLTLSPEEKVVAVKWPNSCWKSELLRSIHILNRDVNAWFPIPAKHAIFWIVPSSKFILFQWNSHRRSQLENAKEHVFWELADVLYGSNVILDEVWDATNQPTAAEVWNRFIPPLLKHRCRIFITSHHDALDDIVKEVWWVLLQPKPWADWKERYKIVRAKENDINYNAWPTLDRIGLTRQAIQTLLPQGDRNQAKRNMPEDRSRNNYWGDDEIPF